MIHELKTWPEPFEAIWQGEKHHEVRVDNRGFDMGDELFLLEWNPTTQEYTKRGIMVLVTHITRAPWVPEPLCVMSFQHVHRDGTLCCSQRTGLTKVRMPAIYRPTVWGKK